VVSTLSTFAQASLAGPPPEGTADVGLPGTSDPEAPVEQPAAALIRTSPAIAATARRVHRELPGTGAARPARADPDRETDTDRDTGRDGVTEDARSGGTGASDKR
jgi:hypothetical protein